MEYLATNTPVIISGLAGPWRAARDWTINPYLDAPSSMGASGARVTPAAINVPAIADEIGMATGCVALCGQREFTDQKREEMSVAAFLQAAFSGADQDDGRLYYLKDFHVLGATLETGLAPPYVCPSLFASDYLNEDCDRRCGRIEQLLETSSEEGAPSAGADDDFRFLYLGPAGSWTPLHADVYRSYSVPTT